MKIRDYNKQTFCDVCRSEVREFHMYQLILNSLKPGETIPDLCDEICCQRWLHIRQVKGWQEWCKANNIKLLYPF